MADRGAAEFHPSHDLELVARAAAGDLAGGEVMGARALVASCATCAELERDLHAIAGATRGLGNAAAVSASRPAPRDFRLSAADADRLRPRGWLRVWRVLAEPRRARGFGGALATLGLVGLLVSTGIAAPFDGADGAASEMTGATKDVVSAAPGVGPASTDDAAALPANPTSSTTIGAREYSNSNVAAAPMLAIASGAMLILGSALLLVSWRSRRVGS
ncbi:MAG: hypothetical protein HW391_1147 [Chloroflexi bacterium]|nr:hypothetical protein [Chloroflexota bacterium]